MTKNGKIPAAVSEALLLEQMMKHSKFNTQKAPLGFGLFLQPKKTTTKKSKSFSDLF